jgi:ferredoxin
MGAAHLVADRDTCIGSQNCLLLAPELFDSDDAGLVVLRRVVEPGESGADAAVTGCPVGALTWTDT